LLILDSSARSGLRCVANVEVAPVQLLEGGADWRGNTVDVLLGGGVGIGSLIRRREDKADLIDRLTLLRLPVVPEEDQDPSALAGLIGPGLLDGVVEARLLALHHEAGDRTLELKRRRVVLLRAKPGDRAAGSEVSRHVGARRRTSVGREGHLHVPRHARAHG